MGAAPALYQNDPTYWAGRPVGSEGAIYFCEPPPGVAGGGQLVSFFWSLTPPSGPAAPPDPRQLARAAIASMRLQAVAIGIVPESRPESAGLVGLPTWMWVADPSATTWGPVTRTASSGGYTVTATAKVDHVTWAMGDGTTVTCHGPGTPYADQFGTRPSPDCGHTYTRQGRYTVTATSNWTVTWSGIGQTGVIPLSFARSVSLVMGEAQALTQ